MLEILKNGATQEAEIVECWKNGAVEEAEGVYAFKNGAEEKVFTTEEMFKFYGFNGNTDSSTYSYSVSDDGLSLEINVTNLTKDDSESSYLYFVIENPQGFGTEITVQYTLTMNVTSYMGAVTWLKGSDFSMIDSSLSAFRYYQSCTMQTFTGSQTLNMAENKLYLSFDAYSDYDNTATISNVYINGVLYKFKP